MDTFKGLHEEIIKGDGGKPFAVHSYRCRRCGSTNEYKDTETRCRRCKQVLDKRDEAKKPISSAQTKAIIDTKLIYRCPTCGKAYDKPEVCCNGEFIKKDDVRYDGYMCQGCSTIYTQPIKCCSGSMMVRGDVYPHMTMQEFEMVRTGLSKPITGIMQ